MPTTTNQGFPLIPASQPRTPTKHRPYLSRDQRLIVLKYREDDWSYSALSRHLGMSWSQVYHTCAVSQQATPKHKSGRKPKLSDQQVSDAIDYIGSDSNIRVKGYDEIVRDLDLPVCGETFRLALKKRGYTKHL